jgi:hypothetical protein
VHAVVNTIALERPLGEEVFETTRRELPERVAAVPGVQAVHVIRTGEKELVLVIVGEDEAALDAMRDAVGDEWMRAHVIPNAAGPPQRVVGEVVFSYQRG